MCKRRMARVLTVAVLLAVAAMQTGTSAGASEPEPEDRVALAVHGPERPVHVGESFTLQLRMSFDAAFFDAHGVPLFRQAMDLPVQLAVPWMAALPGTTRLDVDHALPGTPADTVSLALGDAVVALRRVEDERRDGRLHTVLTAERRFVALAPGALPVPGTVLRFAHASRFEEDFVGGRVALNRADVTVRTPALTIDVRALPGTGRPAGLVDTADALVPVGAYVVSATADPLRVALGESIALTVVIEGEGNLALIDTPRFDLPGFHVFGSIDDRRGGRRTITYDVAPTEAVDALPSVPFAFFDPIRRAYVVVRTDAISIDVVGNADETAADGVAPADGSAQHARRGLGWMWMLFGAFGLFGVAWTVRRRRASAPQIDPATERVRAADAALRGAIDARRTGDGGPADLVEAVAAFLAAHLACPRAAVIGDGLEARLRGAGVRDERARETALLMERLVAARYGGAAVEVDPALLNLFSTPAR